jgi:hypothetical protein
MNPRRKRAESAVIQTAPEKREENSNTGVRLGGVGGRDVVLDARRRLAIVEALATLLEHDLMSHPNIELEGDRR